MMRAYAELVRRLPARVPAVVLRRGDGRAVRQLRPVRRRRGAARRATCRSPSAAACEHPKWGEATVQRYEDDKVVVLFDSVGYKALELDAVSENGLLRPAR